MGRLRDQIPQSIRRRRWLEKLLELIRDPDTGDARRLVIRALRKTSKRKDEVIPELLSYISTKLGVLYIPSARLLGKWKVTAALPRIHELFGSVDQRANALLLAISGDVRVVRLLSAVSNEEHR
jgi:hypothetical protein